VLDAEDFFEVVQPAKVASARNKNLRKGGITINAGQRVQTDDYPGEPPYAHAGIHLWFNGPDEFNEIEWFSDRELNFIIEVGPDPDLYLLPQALAPNQGLSTAFLHDHVAQSFHNPFARNYPVVCVNGSPERSGALRNDADVRAQRFYKFSVTLLGTEIKLDPHIDGH